MEVPLRSMPPHLSVKENLTMPRWAIVFLVIALIAAFFGFAGVKDYSWDGARTVFFVFLVFAVLSFLRKVYGRSSA